MEIFQTLYNKNVKTKVILKCFYTQVTYEILLLFDRFVGVAVLSLAKWLMYDFHYHTIIPTFNEDNPLVNTKVKLLMTDTGG